MITDVKQQTGEDSWRPKIAVKQEPTGESHRAKDNGRENSRATDDQIEGYSPRFPPADLQPTRAIESEYPRRHEKANPCAAQIDRAGMFRDSTPTSRSSR